MKLKNVSDKPILLSWGQYNYSVMPGEVKGLGSDVSRAMLRRFPDQLKPVDAVEVDEVAPLTPVTIEDLSESEEVEKPKRRARKPQAELEEGV